MDQPMQLIAEEKEKLLKAKDEKTWYQVCIKSKPDVTVSILHIYPGKYWKCTRRNFQLHFRN